MARITKEQLQHAFLVWLACSAVICAIPGCLAFREWRFVYWMNTDARQAVATVTAVERPLVKYSFHVGTREYAGSVKLPGERQMDVGDRFDVFYSSSHPWITSLGKPPFQFEPGPYVACGLFICLVVLVIAVVATRDEKAT